MEIENSQEGSKVLFREIDLRGNHKHALTDNRIRLLLFQCNMKY